jgi:hypothetical protein
MAILPTDFRILFTNYDIIAYFLNLASCSEHFINIKHRILATFNKKKKSQFERLYAFNYSLYSRRYIISLMKNDKRQNKKHDIIHYHILY